MKKENTKIITEKEDACVEFTLMYAEIKKKMPCA
jgi:hypothetical protein